MPYATLGDINTELYRSYPAIIRKLAVRTRVLRAVPSYSQLSLRDANFQGLFFHKASKGALTQLYAGTMSDALKLNGEVRITLS